MDRQFDNPGDFSDGLLSSSRRYAIALFIVGLALGVKLLLQMQLGRQPAFPLFYAAVLVSAWYGGFRCGFTAVLLSAAAGMYFFPVNPEAAHRSWQLESLRDLIFVFEGTIICWVIEELHGANRRVERLAHDLLTERFRLVDTAQEGILTVDAVGRIEYINRRMAEMLACNPEQMLGQQLLSVVVDSDHAALRGALSGERRRLGDNCDLHLRRLDGSELIVRLSASPIESEGKLIGTLAMFAEVSTALMSH